MGATWAVGQSELRDYVHTCNVDASLDLDAALSLLQHHSKVGVLFPIHARTSDVDLGIGWCFAEHGSSGLGRDASSHSGSASTRSDEAA